MKKGCLIAVAVVLVLIAGVVAVGGIAFVKINAQYGLLEAPAVSYEQFVNPDTRMRVLLNPDKLSELITHFMPPEALQQIPAWVPLKQNQLISMILPREIALLSGANFGKGAIGFTVFVNERRLGPLAAQLADQSNFFQQTKGIKWDPEFLTSSKRGVLTLGGALPIPDGLESKVLETWSHEVKGEPVAIQGGHFLEAAIDNRSGEIFTFIASAQQASGKDWKDLLNDPYMKTGISILQKILDVRVSGDFTSSDVLKLVVRVGAEPESGPQIEFLANMAVPALATQLEDQYGLKLAGQPKWNAQEKALVGEFTVSGFERLIRQQIQGGAPGGGPKPHPKKAKPS